MLKIKDQLDGFAKNDRDLVLFDSYYAMIY